MCFFDLAGCCQIDEPNALGKCPGGFGILDLKERGLPVEFSLGCICLGLGFVGTFNGLIGLVSLPLLVSG